ncbi:MAG: DUF2058 family protein [Xanthomonadales bacterium]|mgnify:CR=1 FL=1|nr:DUF2058 family protein [Xanthomonadales bacterium]
MVSSLKDALLGVGFKAPEPKAKPVHKGPKPPHHKSKSPSNKPKKPAKAPKPSAKDLMEDENLSLAAAYKARSSQEQRERDLAKRKKEQEAAAKRARLEKVRALIEGKALNVADAEESRYFEYARKIRRIYVTAEQQQGLNAGRLGVVQLKGSYTLVVAEIAREVQAVAPELVALLQAPEPESDTGAGPAAE